MKVGSNYFYILYLEIIFQLLIIFELHLYGFSRAQPRYQFSKWARSLARLWLDLVSQAGVTDDNCRHSILIIFSPLKGEIYLVLFLVLFLSIIPSIAYISHISCSQDQIPHKEQLREGTWIWDHSSSGLSSLWWKSHSSRSVRWLVTLCPPSEAESLCNAEPGHKPNHQQPLWPTPSSEAPKVSQRSFNLPKQLEMFAGILISFSFFSFFTSEFLI